MNAHVLDINTMPSFYHDAHSFPRWFLRQRSATIRTALDIIYMYIYIYIYIIHIYIHIYV